MIIFLDNIFEKCPIFWKNYVRSLPSETDIYVTHDEIHHDLKKYEAVYSENLENSPMLIFKTEQDAMRFILSWV